MFTSKMKNQDRNNTNNTHIQPWAAKFGHELPLRLPDEHNPCLSLSDFWVCCNETLDTELYTEVEDESSLPQAVS